MRKITRKDPKLEDSGQNGQTQKEMIKISLPVLLMVTINDESPHCALPNLTPPGGTKSKLDKM